MSDLILQPTTTAQWLALVSEAEQATGRWLDEESESYLVFLLIRHTDDRQLITQIVGQGYLQSQNLPPNQRQQQLRGVGDHCLLFSGLFPQQAERRHVKLSYFVDLGRSAYQEVANNCQQTVATLYQHLASEFLSLMEILQGIRSLNSQILPTSPIAAYELWQETGSRQAFDQLTRTDTASTAHYRADKRYH